MKHGGRDQAPEQATDVSAREQALLEYLRSMQQVVDAQRDVMLSYLGEGDVVPAGASAPPPQVVDVPDVAGVEVDVADVADVPEVPGVLGLREATEAAAAVQRNGRRINGHIAAPGLDRGRVTGDGPANGQGVGLPPLPPPPPPPPPEPGRPARPASDRAGSAGDDLRATPDARDHQPPRRPPFAERRSRGDVPERPAPTDTTEGGDRVGTPEHGGRADVLERAESRRADRAEQTVRPERAEVAERTGHRTAIEPDVQPERRSRPEMAERRERDERAEHRRAPEAGELAERRVRAEMSEGGERADHRSTPEASELADRPEQAERAEHRRAAEAGGLADRSERGEHRRAPEGAGLTGRSERAERAERAERGERRRAAEGGEPGERRERGEVVEPGERSDRVEGGGRRRRGERRDAEPVDPAEADDVPEIPPRVRRYVLETAMLAPALPVASAAGKTLALISDPWEGLDELRNRLERSGARVQVVPTYRGALGTPLPEAVTSLLARVDGVVHLGAADRRVPVDARDVFAMLQPAVGGLASTLVAAVAPLAPSAPAAVSGVPGLMRALARELPDRHIRAVELSPDQPPEVVARLLADEILDPAGPVSVAYRDGTRITRRVAKGTMPSREIPVLPFDTRSVIVITGGGRGIGAHAAVALARATGCRLELLGRSPLPVDDEDPRTALATDRAALRRVLIELGGPRRTPAEIDYACERIMAAREIRATLQAIQAAGSPVTYHSADVRDRAAIERVLQDVRTRHGHIDAIIHGAGVVDEKLARDKSGDRFDRVFATKVDAARTLLSLLQHDVRLVMFFGSVGGVFGAAGRVDHSAATDALDDLANRLDGIGGRRIVSIDWGPWAAPRAMVPGQPEPGAVSPELEREYARRGIGLIPPDEGVQALLAEMATLPGEPSQVVVMRAEPEAFMDHREATPVTLPVTNSRQIARHRRPPGPDSADRRDPRHLAVKE